MRGPDSYYGETLKWFTTGVLRGQVRKVFRVGGTVNSDLHIVILPDDWGTQSYKDRTSWNAAHFIEHIQEAASWLKVPVLVIPSKIWHEALGTGLNIQKAAKLILKNQAADLKNSSRPELYAELSRHYEDYILPHGL